MLDLIDQRQQRRSVDGQHENKAAPVPLKEKKNSSKEHNARFVEELLPDPLHVSVRLDHLGVVVIGPREGDTILLTQGSTSDGRRKGLLVAGMWRVDKGKAGGSQSNVPYDALRGNVEGQSEESERRTRQPLEPNHPRHQQNPG